MKMIMPTCDKYRNILEANKYTVDKFGGKDMEVVVLGYKKPDFDMGNWKFISLGEDTGAKNFSNDMIKFFSDFNDEFFIFGNDDMVVVDNLDLKLIDELTDVMRKDEKIGRMLFTIATKKNITQYDLYEKRDGYDLIQLKPDAEYRLSLHCSIWRTSYFKKYLIPNIDPWTWELRGSAKYDGVKIVASLGRYVFDFGHVFRRDIGDTGLWVSSEYSGKRLSDEDIQFVKGCISKCFK